MLMLSLSLKCFAKNGRRGGRVSQPVGLIKYKQNLAEYLLFVIENVDFLLVFFQFFFYFFLFFVYNGKKGFVWMCVFETFGKVCLICSIGCVMPCRDFTLNSMQVEMYVTNMNKCMCIHMNWTNEWINEWVNDEWII